MPGKLNVGSIVAQLSRVATAGSESPTAETAIPLESQGGGRDASGGAVETGQAGR